MQIIDARWERWEVSARAGRDFCGQDAGRLTVVYRDEEGREQSYSRGWRYDEAGRKPSWLEANQEGFGVEVRAGEPERAFSMLRWVAPH